MNIYNKLHNLIFFFKGFFFFLRIDYYFKLNSNVLIAQMVIKCFKIFILGTQVLAHTLVETGNGPNRPNTIDLDRKSVV